MNQIHSTVSNYRTHIAVNQHYQGSVNSYNNCVTRAFSKLFGISTDVNINGKQYTLNKKSYRKFLRSIDAAGASDLRLLHYKDLNAVSFKPITNHGLMRNHISASKSARLGKKLIKAMNLGDSQRAARFLGKGAEIERRFWIRHFDNRIINKDTFTSGLPHQKINPFQATQYTPFLLAAVKNDALMMKLLAQFGANTAQKGKACTFSRELTGVNNDVSFVPTINHSYTLHHHMHRHHGQLHHHQHVVPHAQLGLNMVTSQRLHFVDTYANNEVLSFDPVKQAVIAKANPSENRAHSWSRENMVGNSRII